MSSVKLFVWFSVLRLRNLLRRIVGVGKFQPRTARISVPTRINCIYKLGSFQSNEQPQLRVDLTGLLPLYNYTALATFVLQLHRKISNSITSKNVHERCLLREADIYLPFI